MNLPPIDYDAYRAHILLQSTATLSEPSLAAQVTLSLPVPAPEAKQSASNAQSTEPFNASDTNPPYPVSFAQIVELITSGAPIPGIRDIPPTVLSDQATKPTARKRPKPWEEKIVEGESTFGDHRVQVIAQEIPVEDGTIREATHEQDNEHVSQG
jgi:hypothetical protein